MDRRRPRVTATAAHPETALSEIAAGLTKLVAQLAAAAAAQAVSHGDPRAGAPQSSGARPEDLGSLVYERIAQAGAAPGDVEPEIVMVYDLGGGTFDVSVLEVFGGVREVRATAGNTQLGGDDIDELLFRHFADHLQHTRGVDVQADPRGRAKLRSTAERTKIALSSELEHGVHEEFVSTWRSRASRRCSPPTASKRAVAHARETTRMRVRAGESETRSRRARKAATKSGRVRTRPHEVSARAASTAAPGLLEWRTRRTSKSPATPLSSPAMSACTSACSRLALEEISTSLRDAGVRGVPPNDALTILGL